MQPSLSRSCVPGCHEAVPPELQEHCLCVLHFLLDMEHTCADMRRETALQKASSTRRSEIANYIKVTSMKLSEVAVGQKSLTDELKRRILSAFLTLMNLRDGLERSAIRSVPALQAAKPPVAAVPGARRGGSLTRIPA